MGKIIRNGVEFSGTLDNAANINYNNSLSGMEVTTVQEAIDEVIENLGGLRFGTDGDGNFGYYGADGSLIPFSSGDVELTELFFQRVVDVKSVQTVSYTFDKKIIGYIIATTSNANNNFKRLNTPTISEGSILTTIYEIGTNLDSPYGLVAYIGKIEAQKGATISCEIGSYDWGESFVQILGCESVPNSVSGGGSTDIIKIVPLVPTMTSNTGSDGGEASVSSAFGGSNAYAVFDDNNSTIWHSEAWTPQWVQYKFTKPTCVKNFRLVTSTNGGITARLQASNDNSSWEDLSQLIVFPIANYIYETDVNNEQYYLYYRLYVEESYYVSGGAPYVVISGLQFYGYQMEALIPKMTSNTAPSGEVFASSVYNSTSYPLYYAFDGSDSTLGCFTNVDGGYLGYKFTEPVCAKRMLCTSYTKESLKLQASYDNSKWIDLTDTFVISEDSTVKTKSVDVENSNSYLYYRLYQVGKTSTDSGTALHTFQLYAEPEGIGGLPVLNDDSFQEVGSSVRGTNKTYTIEKPVKYYFYNVAGYGDSGAIADHRNLIQDNITNGTILSYKVTSSSDTSGSHTVIIKVNDTSQPFVLTKFSLYYTDVLYSIESVGSTDAPAGGDGIEFYVDFVNKDSTYNVVPFNVPCPKNAKKVCFSIDKAIVQTNTEIQIIVNSNIVHTISTSSSEETFNNITKEFDLASNDGTIQVVLACKNNNAYSVWAQITGLTITIS